jgi:hypothetical protein
MPPLRSRVKWTNRHRELREVSAAADDNLPGPDTGSCAAWPALAWNVGDSTEVVIGTLIVIFVEGLLIGPFSLSA